MLTGAGFSPDGSRLAYLSVALPSKDDLERVKGFEQRLQSEDPAIKAEAAKEPWIFAVPPDAVGRAPKPLHKTALDVGLPPVLENNPALPDSGALLPAELVVRDAATGAVSLSLPIDVPFNSNDTVLFNYLWARPQWLPDGQRIVFYLQGLLAMATVPDGEVRLLAAGAAPGPVSPDGSIVASLINNGLKLAATDGSRSVYVRLGDKMDKSGASKLAWIGTKGLAVLSIKKPGAFVVDVFDREGKPLRSLTLTLAGQPKEGRVELAISPDAKTMVIDLGSRAHFLNIDGQPLGEWQAPNDQEILARPTFSPDSQQVAFRYMAAGDDKRVRTAAIVFFSPQGKELFRVAVPPVVPAVTPAQDAAAHTKPAEAAGK
jgi:hypothetical protein